MSVLMKLMVSLIVCSYLVSAINITSLSSACQTTIDHSGYSDKISNCNSLTSTSAAKLTLVVNGFCTELEFYNIESATCGQSSESRSSSDAKTSFYNAFNNVSANCQGSGFSCIKDSISGILMKQQEKYCILMNIDLNGHSLKSCLTNPDSRCTSDEVNRLQSAACANNNTSADQKFANAVLGTTQACQSKISYCGGSSDDAKAMVTQQRYCDAFNIKVGTDSTETCFTSAGGCTSAEFSTLKEAACDASILTWNLITVVLSYITVFNFM
ncbi:hypothetical protein BgiBS90_008048 [Biomphalaria glabrata]|nr:hypothetical protein BgiBS90_008048 [Biomphalaria glabrata]